MALASPVAGHELTLVERRVEDWRRGGGGKLHREEWTHTHTQRSGVEAR